VSEEVAQALRVTGRARGPLIVIPDGLDLDSLPVPNGATRDVGMLIVALKQPELGEELGHRLKQPGRCIDVLSERLSWPEFLSRIQEARTTAFLPNKIEGFYLPALEGIALGTLVMCRDFVGNRSFCLPDNNAFRTDYTCEEIVQAAESALALPPDQAQRIRTNAPQTAETHSLLREQQTFLDVLHNIDQLWKTRASGVPLFDNRPTHS